MRSPRVLIVDSNTRSLLSASHAASILLAIKNSFRGLLDLGHALEALGRHGRRVDLGLEDLAQRGVELRVLGCRDLERERERERHAT